MKKPTLSEVERVFDEIARLDRTLFQIEGKADRRKKKSQKLSDTISALHRVNYGGKRMRELVKQARQLEKEAHDDV